MLASMPWWLFSLLSNACIILIEYANGRGGGASWIATLPRTIVPIAIAQFCLFRAFSGAPNWYLAWAVFTVGNAVMRLLGVAALAPQQVGQWGYVVLGVSIMVGGSLILKLGLR